MWGCLAGICIQERVDGLAWHALLTNTRTINEGLSVSAIIFRSFCNKSQCLLFIASNKYIHPRSIMSHETDRHEIYIIYNLASKNYGQLYIRIS